MLPSFFFDVTRLQIFDVKLVSILQFSIFPYSILLPSIELYFRLFAFRKFRHSPIFEFKFEQVEIWYFCICENFAKQIKKIITKINGRLMHKLCKSSSGEPLMHLMKFRTEFLELNDIKSSIL